MRAGPSPRHKWVALHVAISADNSSNLRIATRLTYSLSSSATSSSHSFFLLNSSFSFTGIFFSSLEKRNMEQVQSNLFDTFIFNGIHVITPKISTGNYPISEVSGNVSNTSFRKEIALFIPHIVRFGYCGSCSFVLLFTVRFCSCTDKISDLSWVKKRDLCAKMLYESKHFPRRITRLCSAWEMGHVILLRKTEWKPYALKPLLYRTAYLPPVRGNIFPHRTVRFSCISV